MAEAATIRIQAIKLRKVEIALVGETPLICHAWSEKAKRMMLDSHMKKAKAGKEAKDPFADFANGLYWMGDKPENPTESDVETGRFGFPTIAFKSAAVSASALSGAKMTQMRQAFHIDEELVEILGPAPSMRFDITKVGMTIDTRFRGEFSPWAVVLPVKFNASAISEEQLLSLFEAGGFGVGVGEWRPARNGPYGRFRVARAGEELPCRA